MGEIATSYSVMTMDDDTATFIANCYHDTKAYFIAPVEEAVRKTTIARVAIQMGWEITNKDIDAALAYVAAHPLG